MQRLTAARCGNLELKIQLLFSPLPSPAIDSPCLIGYVWPRNYQACWNNRNGAAIRVNLSFSRLLYGFTTYIPGVYRHFSMPRPGPGDGYINYSTWLQHLVIARQNGLPAFPKVVAEIGPGSSLGVGLAALISGVDTCYFCDIIDQTDISPALRAFDEIVRLFKERKPLSPDLLYLKELEFPAFLTEEHMRKALNDDRLSALRKAITNRVPGSAIRFCVPWDKTSAIPPRSVDLIISSNVFEHVDEPGPVYEAARHWLKQDGLMSHIIDFSCHAAANNWNGHWAYSDFLWKLYYGNRPYFINRQPLSYHLALLKKTGIKVAHMEKITKPSSLARKQLAMRFAGMSDEDFNTSGVMLICRPA